MVFSSSGVTLISTGPLLGCAWGGRRRQKPWAGQVARDFRHDVHFHEYGAFFACSGCRKMFSVSELVPSLSPPEMTSARRVFSSDSCREILFTFAWTVRPGQSTQNFCDGFGAAGRQAARLGIFPRGWLARPAPSARRRLRCSEAVFF